MLTVLANGEAQGGVGDARRVLARGGTALDAVEAGIRQVEADERIDSVGKGGRPCLTGEVECDAAVMNGRTMEAGAVGALKGFLHPVSVARRVMEVSPHVLLVGEGAVRFAREVDAEQAEILTQERKAEFEQWLDEHVPAAQRGDWPGVPLAEHAWEAGRELKRGGTAIMLCKDRQGDIAAGTSSSGWAYGYPGRLGDSAVVGAGLYADNRYGACACTHFGEMTIRAVTARAVVQALAHGKSVSGALSYAVRELRRLEGGFVGPVAVHAIDFYGNPGVASTEDLGVEGSYVYWQEGQGEPKIGQAAVIGG